MTKKITINLDEYLNLVRNSLSYQLIQQAVGESTWDWYEDAFSDEAVLEFFPNCPEATSGESRFEAMLKYFEFHATLRSFEENENISQQTPFWRPIEECPKIDGKEYLLWWTEMPKVVQARWHDNYKLWLAGWTSFRGSDEYISHYAEIPLPEEKAKS